jgi:hypothetical protein
MTATGRTVRSRRHAGVRQRARAIPLPRVNALTRQVPGTRWDGTHRAAIVDVMLPGPDLFFLHVLCPSG